MSKLDKSIYRISKKGEPKGHDGTTLPFSNQPDEVIVHAVSTCSGCSPSLESVESQTCEIRQVFDLPPPRIWITEHRAQKKCCPQCGLHQRAAFPDRVQAPTQYGAGFTTHVVSDKELTLLGVHPNRGSKGMDDLGFIPSYAGTIVHDCLPTRSKLCSKPTKGRALLKQKQNISNSLTHALYGKFIFQ